MAAEEILESTITRLRSNALEVYGVIKDKLKAPAEQGVVNEIASLAVQLAQLEGAMVTLQQYREAMVNSIRTEEAQLAARVAAGPAMQVTDPEPQEATEVEVEEETEEDNDPAMGHDELLERSPTYKQAVETEKLKEKLRNESQE